MFLQQQQKQRQQQQMQQRRGVGSLPRARMLIVAFAGVALGGQHDVMVQAFVPGGLALSSPAAGALKGGGAFAGGNPRGLGLQVDATGARSTSLRMVTLSPTDTRGRSASLPERPEHPERKRNSPSGGSSPVAQQLLELEVEQRRLSASEPVPGREGCFLPWTQSIAGPAFPLTYMGFFEKALNKLAARMPGLEVVAVPKELGYSENLKKKARILSLEFKSDAIRKARLTYFDAGDAVQVFNMVLYPKDHLETPLFGVDLISFGGKHLAGIDFQPLVDGDEEYNAKYLDQLGPVRAKYPTLGQKISQRFYDSAQFFSPHMLFGRYEDREVIKKELAPAFDEYMDSYLDTLQASVRESTTAETSLASTTGIDIVDRQRAYDQYNAARDPAHGLFVKYFGEEWSHRYMDEFLFERSVRPEGGYPKVQRGPPPPPPQAKEVQASSSSST